MARATRNQLMDDIYDQFLICKICYELYKRPKTLQCLHTFCMECLEKHQDAELERSYRYLMYTRAISCPICRKKTELPSGGVRRLPDNFLVANLGAIISRRLPEANSTLCEICKPTVPAKFKEAVTRCLDCSKLLCQACVELHKKTKVTQAHSLFDIDVEKDIECKVHVGETVRYYCEPCEMCICVVCTFQEHKGHEVSSFSEGMEKHQTSLDNLVEICKERIDLVKDQLDIIYKCEGEIKHAEESIRDMAIETIGDIRHKEREFVQNVHQVYGEETFEFIKEKDDLQENLDSLQSTCNLTDIIVKDNKMELLLMKKEIQEKMKTLLERQVRQPPENAMKGVKFVPGNCVFGYLQVKSSNGEPAYVEEKAEALCNGDVDLPPFPYSKGMLVDTMAQTDFVEKCEKWTTMGNLLKQISDQLTQTDTPSTESGTSPQRLSTSNPTTPAHRSRSSSTDTRERQTMTPCTPTIKRRTQTDDVKTCTEGTETIDTLLSSKFTNTKIIDSCERSTLTKVFENVTKGTDTAGLYNFEDSATETSSVYLSTTATLTDKVATFNKSSGTPYSTSKDKMCGTTKVCHTNRETMTKYVAKLDMGVTAAPQGEHKSVGTKTIVTTHSFFGDGDVRTHDQECETPWKSDYVPMIDQSTMHDVTMKDYGQKTEPWAIYDKETYTNWFNMVDKSTEPKPSQIAHAATSTSLPPMKTRGLNTVPLPTSDKGIFAQQEFLPKKPKMEDCLSQTVISFDRNILMPNLLPCDKNVATEQVQETICVIRSTASFSTIATNTVSSARKDSNTTMLSNVFTRDSSQTTIGHNQSTVATDTVSIQPKTLEQGTAMLKQCFVDTENQTDTKLVKDKHFGSQSVIYLDESVGTNPLECSSIGIGVSPHMTDMCTGTSIQTSDASTEYNKITTAAAATSTPSIQTVECQSNTERVDVNNSSTMTHIITQQSQQTTMGHYVGVADVSVATTQKKMVSQGQNPVTVQTQNTGMNTPQMSMAERCVGTERVEKVIRGTTTHHIVFSADKHQATDELVTCDMSTGMDIVMKDESTHTHVETADVGVLKRPHALSRGVNTKRSKFVTRSSGPDQLFVQHHQCMTDISYGNRDINYADKALETLQPSLVDRGEGTLHVETIETSTGMPKIEYTERESSPVLFNTTEDRSSSPIDWNNLTERACSPIEIITHEKGVSVKPKTREVYTVTKGIKTIESGVNPARPFTSDKESSPVRNLISTRTKHTCTPQTTFLDRAGSPIPISTSEGSTNTAVHEYVDREASPVRVPVTDQGITATVAMQSKSAGTPHIMSKEQATHMKKVTFLDSGTAMPKVSFADRDTSTIRIHMMHKNITTENIITHDQSTQMAAGVAELYKDLVMPAKAVTVTRGTCTKNVSFDTKGVGTPPPIGFDKASSPVRALTADKGVTASKADMMECKESFQGVGKNKSKRQLSGSQSKLECISEQSPTTSDEDMSTSTDTLPDLTPIGSPRIGSPRLLLTRKVGLFAPFSEGRPQMGLGMGHMGQREKIWRSSPVLGASSRSVVPTMGGMLHGRLSPPSTMVKTEIGTNTKEVDTETRSTSTTDIGEENKVVCTEAVTMQSKMAECISKLKTVRQRLEQQPIYSQATSTETSTEQSTVHSTNAPLLSVKSKSISNINENDSPPFSSPSIKRRPTLSLIPSNCGTSSESHSESSDQDVPGGRSRADKDKARKHRLDITQLLRSSSLPESDDPPADTNRIPPGRAKITIPVSAQSDNKGNADTVSESTKNRSKPPRDASKMNKDTLKERSLSGTRERPKSARDRSKERPKVIHRQRSLERLKVTKENSKDTLKPKRDVKLAHGGVGDLKTKRPISPKAPKPPTLSPKETRKSKTRPTAKFDEVHPLLPTSPRNTRRLSDGTEAIRQRLGETPKQRRERLEQQMTFEDRKALTRQYFADQRPGSPKTGAKPRVSRTTSSNRDLSSLAEKPPKVPPHHE